MRFCTNCGSAIPEDAQFCTHCGTKNTSSGSEQPALPRAAGDLYFVTYATGQTGGPFSEEALRTMITHQQVKVADCIRAEGSESWVPVVQSKFAPLVTQQTAMNRLTASTCPMCGAGMAVVIKRSKVGLALVILGICLTPLFGIGIPIFVVGFIMRWSGKGRAAYQCPRCNYISQ